jgi:hypothetical protein
MTDRTGIAPSDTLLSAVAGVPTALAVVSRQLGPGLARLVLAVFPLLIAPVALAERHALLVGVSDYPNLAKDKQLRGPRNDVPAIREALLQRGFADARIRVLADGVEGAALPTRAAILAALNGLANTVARGDFVFVYFGGHGALAPTDAQVPPAYRRPDGRQPIFLPRDAAMWDRALERVPNAIADYVLVPALDALRARGAFVWSVFDACHSATLVRGDGGASDEAGRQLSARDLGIPAAAYATPERAVGAATRGPADLPLSARSATVPASFPGAGYVAFYAAQQDEVTPEYRLPEGAPDRVVRGLFSYWFVRSLAGAGDVTYRQLGEYILRSYAAIPRMAPTPMWTGTHLDSPIFGDARSARVPQWPLLDNGSGGWILRAGQLQQLGPGSLLAVLPSPLSGDEATLGYVRVVQADTLQAIAEPVAHLGKPALGHVPAGSYGRLRAGAVDFTLRVAVQSRSAVDERALRQVVAAVQAAWPREFPVDWVPTSRPHDVRIEAADGKLWLLASGVRRPHGSTVSPGFDLLARDLATELRGRMLKTAKALNLLRIAASLGAHSDPAISVSLAFERKGDTAPLEQGSVVQLEVDDIVYVTVRSLRKTGAVDVTALYVDEGNQIVSLGPEAVGRCRPNVPAEHACLRFAFRLDAATTGLERLLIVAVDAVSMSERFDFSYLAEPTLRRSRAGADDIVALFDEAGFGANSGAATRAGATTAAATARVQMQARTFRVARAAR